MQCQKETNKQDAHSFSSSECDNKKTQQLLNLKIMDKNICSICGKEYQGYGNNARPVNNGRCCNECNFTVVFPARLVEIHKMNNKKKNK